MSDEARERYQMLAASAAATAAKRPESTLTESSFSSTYAGSAAELADLLDEAGPGPAPKDGRRGSSTPRFRGSWSPRVEDHVQAAAAEKGVAVPFSYAVARDVGDTIMEGDTVSCLKHGQRVEATVVKRVGMQLRVLLPDQTSKWIARSEVLDPSEGGGGGTEEGSATAAAAVQGITADDAASMRRTEPDSAQPAISISRAASDRLGRQLSKGGGAPERKSSQPQRAVGDGGANAIEWKHTEAERRRIIQRSISFAKDTGHSSFARGVGRGRAAQEPPAGFTDEERDKFLRVVRDEKVKEKMRMRGA